MMRQSGVVHSIISDRDRYAFPVTSVLAPKAESELVHWQPIRWDFAKSGARLLIQATKEGRPLAHAAHSIDASCVDLHKRRIALQAAAEVVNVPTASIVKKPREDTMAERCFGNPH